MMLTKGQRVLVRAYPDKQLERVVLKEEKTYVLVCRPEVYQTVKDSEILPNLSMGFPKEDIIKVLEPVT